MVCVFLCKIVIAWLTGLLWSFSSSWHNTSVLGTTFARRALVLQDKLTPSEELGDLMRRAGDNDAALAIYQQANVPQKVIEGLAAKGDFEALSKFR